MSTISFTEDNAAGVDDLSMDGFDVDESTGEVVEEAPQEDLPVPGYVPQPGDVLPTQPTVARQETIETLTEETEEDYGAVMDQVDRRMKVANYFRLVLDNDLFAGDESPEAKLAQNRLRKYVREELEVLLGMRKSTAPTVTAVPASQFTEEEVSALKELARLAIRKLKNEPQLQPIAAKPVVQPQLKPVTAASVVPAPKKPAPPKVQQPQAKPVAQKPAPAVQQRPAAAPRGPVDPRIPEKYRNDPTAKVVNGKVFVQARDEDGNLIYVTHPKTKRRIPSMKDVTPVAKPMGVTPLPMPSFAQMDQMAAVQATQNIGVIQSFAAHNPNVAALAGAAALHLQGGPPQQQNPDEALSGDERPF